jgi:hypothetical protein
VLPSQIISELQTLVTTSRQGIDALYDAEIALAEAENELDKTEAKAFLGADGTVAERQYIAKYKSADARLARDVARAAVNRVRTKIRVLEGEVMAQATISKLVQAEMKL